MPFKSRAQIKKFYQLKSQGKMSQETIDQWMSETPDPNKLPNRVKKASVIEGFKKVAGTLLKCSTSVIADEALQDSYYGFQDRVPGTEARDKMETGQAIKKNMRTQGVRNEDKEFAPKHKNKAQTARGGKHYGGTIQQGFSENRDDDAQSIS